MEHLGTYLQNFLSQHIQLTQWFVPHFREGVKLSPQPTPSPASFVFVQTVDPKILEGFSILVFYSSNLCQGGTIG